MGGESSKQTHTNPLESANDGTDKCGHNANQIKFWSQCIYCSFLSTKTDVINVGEEHDLLDYITKAYDVGYDDAINNRVNFVKTNKCYDIFAKCKEMDYDRISPELKYKQCMPYILKMYEKGYDAGIVYLGIN